MQVRARRRLSAESAKLLGDVLSKSMKRTQHNIRVQEGKTKLVTLSTRERNRTLRVLALTKRGTICEICGFDFTETYGEFARNCVEVHHLEALAGSNRNGVTTSLNTSLSSVQTVIAPFINSKIRATGRHSEERVALAARRETEQ